MTFEFGTVATHKASAHEREIYVVRRETGKE